MDNLKPEERARKKIDEQLRSLGWKVVTRSQYCADGYPVAVMEALLNNNLEADYLLFLEGKAIGVIEAKYQESTLDEDVQQQAEKYAHEPPYWITCWRKPLPIIFLSNGNQWKFRNLCEKDSKYEEISNMLPPHEVARMAEIQAPFAGIPSLEYSENRGIRLRNCQREAILNLEASFRKGKRRALLSMATGSGKTFTACMATYRLLAYAGAKRVLFLVDRCNLGLQAKTEFADFKLTRSGKAFTTEYQVDLLRAGYKPSNNSGEVVIGTIQRLFAVLNGDEISTNDAEEDEIHGLSDGRDDVEDDTPPIEIGDASQLLSNYFDYIVIDECHRSIYGKWRKVLEWFNSARIIGLTATPNKLTEDFFDENTVVKYTIGKSIVDGVNVGYRVYSILTRLTLNGGMIEAGTTVDEVSNKTGEIQAVLVNSNQPFMGTDLDRQVVVPNQIKLILETYKKIVYDKLFHSREKQFGCLPKTLIFAKNEDHANRIVEIIREVFPDQCPEFVQKVTCTVSNSDEVIKNFRTDKKFRIAVTVTLMSTGTDIRSLEVLIFMRDVESQTLFTQMIGRGCRSIKNDKLRQVTPNADKKDIFYVVDAVGVTQHLKNNLPLVTSEIPVPPSKITLEKLLEQIAHDYLTDDNLELLMERLSRINQETDDQHRKRFEECAGVSMYHIAQAICNATEDGSLNNNPFAKEGDNSFRKKLVRPLASNADAMNLLIKINAGFTRIWNGKDEIEVCGFSKEDAQQTVTAFKGYLQQNQENGTIRAITDHSPVTRSMLDTFGETLITTNELFTAPNLWEAYLRVDQVRVKPLENEDEKKAKTNLIPLVRFAFGQEENLRSIYSRTGSLFELWCGQTQRGGLSEAQRRVALDFASLIAINGAITAEEYSDSRGEIELMQAVNAFGDLGKVDATLKSLAGFLTTSSAMV